MAKIFTPKRFELREVGNLLKTLPDNEHAKTKAKELSKVKIQNNKFTHIAQDNEIYDIQIYELSYASHGLLKVIATAKRNGKDLFLDNPLYFGNPPIMVHDGTYHKEIDSFTGQEKDVRNYVEDLEQALKEMVVDTIRITGK